MEEELKHFGVRFKELGCRDEASGWVAIGIKDWVERRTSCFRWMGKGIEPKHVVNDHILVFDVPPKD
jgi:hypothetical protein